MDRRSFLKLTATGTGGFYLLPGFLTAHNLWNKLDTGKPGNILVFIQLNGGNDGLNTCIPYLDPLYYSNRPTISVPKSNVIQAANGMGFHPALNDFSSMLQAGDLSIVQNVGYPNPNRSHFRSQEIWQTASGSKQYLDHGWLGRYLDIQCKDESLPALNLDAVDNLALKAASVNALTVKDLKRVNSNTFADPTSSLSENPQLDFVRSLQTASLEGMDAIQRALKQATGFNEVYAQNALAKNLEWIAKLIKGNLASSVYYTSLSGFDTHNNQVQLHQKQLTILNDAVYSFYKDLKGNDLLDQVTLVVFSEFGRRVKENGTGTDHGTAGPMFIVGGKNKGSIIGKNPDLNTLDQGDLIHQIDFRSVYASLLQNKFSFDPKQIGIQASPLTGLFG
jgi:uncharacterized protein (DUF1501 family)